METEFDTNTDDKTTVEELYIRLKEYADTRISLLKLKGIRKVSSKLSSLIVKIVLLALFVFMLFFISAGVALWLGTLLGEMYYGFFIVGGIYILTGLVFWIFKKPLIKAPLINWLTRNLLSDD